MTDFVYLSKVRRFIIPRPVLKRTRELLAEPGGEGLEACVLWAGRSGSEGRFNITTPIFPSQEATSLDFHVAPPAVNDVFDTLARKDLVLAGQVHTHPGEAFHSLTDDAFPLATQIGSLSVVIPDFAAHPLGDLAHCAVYRLGHHGWGGPLPPGELHELIRVSENKTWEETPP